MNVLHWETGAKANNNNSSLDNIHYYFYTESAGIYEV